MFIYCLIFRKFVLNGGLILGTVDGANIEIGEEIGKDNIWLFGATADQVDDIRHEKTYRQMPVNEHLEAVLSSIRRGDFGNGHLFESLLATLESDYYLIAHDFKPCKFFKVS
jgi:starch phosphorylase